MDEGPERVTDAAELAAIRAQARSVLLKSLMATGLVMTVWAVVLSLT